MFVFAMMVAQFQAAHADDKPQHPEMWMFDDKPITATSPVERVKQAAVTGRLYGRVFFDRPIREVYELTPQHSQIRVYATIVDTGSQGNATIWIAPKHFDNKWLDLEIFPDPKTAHTKFGAYGETFYRIWSDDRKLDGKHEVQWEIVVGGGNGAAPTEVADADKRRTRFAIDFTGYDYKKMAELSKLVAAAGNEAFSANMTVPKPGRLHTAALAKQTEEMTKKTGKDIATVKVIFTEAAWGLERNEVSGKILARVAGASAIVKTRAGKCMVEPGVIRQPYVGGTYKAPGVWLNTSLTPYQIACDKAFK